MDYYILKNVILCSICLDSRNSSLSSVDMHQKYEVTIYVKNGLDCDLPLYLYSATIRARETNDGLFCCLPQIGSIYPIIADVSA